VVVERLTQERRKELTRTTLVAAAAEVFARKGFVAASLDEIADAAGYTRGAIHFHFGSKEDLFLAVLARHEERLLAAYVERRRASESFAVDAAGNASEWTAVHAAGGVDDVLLQLEFSTYALRNPGFCARAAELEQRTVAATAEHLVQLAEQRGLRWKVPVEQVSELLHVTSRGLVERSVITGRDEEATFGAFLSMLWQHALEPLPTEE
jgi:AcrR family transcriptional regulator